MKSINKSAVHKYRLTEEEKEILEAFENAQTVRGSNPELSKKIAMKAGHNFTKKTERINIRLTKQDLAGVKNLAAREGIPYQTLISSILHKYAMGYLKI